MIRVKGGDTSASRGYERAAHAVAGCGADVSDLDVEALCLIPGVSRAIAEEILGFLDTGHVEAIDVLRLGSVEGTFVPSGSGG